MSRRQVFTRGASFAAAIAIAGAGEANAQTYPPPGGGYAQPPPPPGYYAPPPRTPDPPGVLRDGFVIGFGIGGGTMAPADCDECEGESGPGVYFKIGAMLTPRLALLFDASDLVAPRDYITIVHVVYTAALQYWITPQFWIEGGVGIGILGAYYDDGYDTIYTDREQGPAGMLAAGFELMQSRNFAMDLQLRFASTTIRADQDFPEDFTMNNVSLLLGFNWY